MIKTVNLTFHGSLSDSDRSYMPSYGGVYIVYRGIWSEKDRLFFCREIVYIGQADDIKSRHEHHEYHQDFLSQCRQGEIVFYSFAEVNLEDRDIVEAALIYHTRPKLNRIELDQFPYPPIRVVSTGACALLDPDIIVE